MAGGAQARGGSSTSSGVSELSAQFEQSSFFDQFPFGCSVRTQDGVILSVNREFRELVGLTQAQLVGKRLDAAAPRFAALDPPGTIADVVAQAQPVNRQVQILDHDWARMQLLDVTDFPIFNATNEVTQIGQSVRDITSYEQTRLATSRALANFSFPHITDNVGSWSVPHGSEVGSWSPQMYRLMGRDPSLRPLTVSEFFERVVPDDRPAVTKALSDQLDTGNPVDIECSIVTEHGNLRSLRIWALVEADVQRGLAQDITAARDIEFKHERDLERYRHLFTDSPIGILVHDLNYKILDANPAICRMLGYDRDQMLKLDIEDVAHHNALAEINAQREALASGQIESMHLESEVMRADGHPVWTSRESALLRNDRDEPFEIVTQIVDVSGARKQVSELQRLADEDPLTGVLNRRSFSLRLNYEIDAVSHGARPGVVMMADIDNLKPVNDKLGHAAGDRLLIQLARALRKNVRASDFIGRMGGDEFAVLMPSCDRKHAERAARAIVDELGHKHTFDFAGERHGTVSIGIAILDSTSPDGFDPMSAADSAMYQAKVGGGGQVVFNSASDCA